MRAFCTILSAFLIVLTILFEPFLNYYEAKYMRNLKFIPEEIISFSQNILNYTNSILSPNFIQEPQIQDEITKPQISQKQNSEILTALLNIQKPNIDINFTIKSGIKALSQEKNETKKEPKSEQISQNLIEENTTKQPKIIQLKSQKPKPEKRVMLLIGDSIAKGVGWGLAKKFKGELKNLAKVSTGLVNTKFYNWQNELENALANSENIGKNIVVVALFGANDGYSFGGFKFNTKAWDDEYTNRIDAIYKTSKKYNATLVWLGVPCMKESKFNSKMTKLNSIFKAVSEQNQSLFIDISTVLCKNNSFVKSKKINDKLQIIRSEDGIHISPNGAKIAAEYILKEMKF